MTQDIQSPEGFTRAVSEAKINMHLNKKQDFILYPRDNFISGFKIFSDGKR